MSLRAEPSDPRSWARLARALLPRGARRHEDVPLVHVVCPGGGRVVRGYEVKAANLAALLVRRPGVDVKLVQGGPSDELHVQRIRLLDRHRAPARLLARLTPFYPTSIEHYSFGLLSLPLILRDRPDTIVLSERVLANLYDVVLRALAPPQPGLC